MITALSGSTGFIGRSLLRKLNSMDWPTRIINRDALALTDKDFLEQTIEGAEVIINLAGAPVTKKWTPDYKKEILDSRVNTTRKISNAINSSRKKPALFISASAIGIYDSVNIHTEFSTAYSDSFLARVCREWEQEAIQSDRMTRVVILRIGMVLGKNGGALEKMHGPFSMGLGGKVGNGKQAISFIHIDDLVNAILFIIDNPSLSGVINAVSPFPCNNLEFTDKLAKALKQPAWFTVPAIALKMVYGEGAQVLLEGQQVIPEKLQQAGFRFSYPTIQNALVNIYR